jgi:hypothetical protein
LNNGFAAGKSNADAAILDFLQVLLHLEL